MGQSQCGFADLLPQPGGFHASLLRFSEDWNSYARRQPLESPTTSIVHLLLTNQVRTDERLIEITHREGGKQPGLLDIGLAGRYVDLLPQQSQFGRLSQRSRVGQGG